MPARKYLLSIILAIPAIGFTQTDTASKLKEHLLQNNGAFALKIAGVHATTDMLGRPMDVKIVDGAVSRGAGSFFHGKQDIVLPTGQPIQVSNVEITHDTKNDLVRLGTTVSGNPLSFVFLFPLNSIATMNEQQLESAITAVLQPASSAGPSTSPFRPQQGGTATGGNLIGSEGFSPATATVLPIKALAPFANRLLAGGGVVTSAKIEGICLATNNMNARESIIKSGTLQPASGFFHGVRCMYLNPGQPIQIKDIRGLDDGEHDILHFIIMQPDLPSYGNVAFVFPKGQLSTIPEPDVEALVGQIFVLPRASAPLPPANSQGALPPSDSGSASHYTYVIEGIGLGMTLDQVRTAAKTAGSIKGLVKQGPTTYNVETRDLSFQLELNQSGAVKQYHVSAHNLRHLPETAHTGPLYTKLVAAFGPANGWGKQVVYDLGEGEAAYAIVSDTSYF